MVRVSSAALCLTNVGLTRPQRALLSAQLLASSTSAACSRIWQGASYSCSFIPGPASNPDAWPLPKRCFWRQKVWVGGDSPPEPAGASNTHHMTASEHRPPRRFLQPSVGEQRLRAGRRWEHASSLCSSAYSDKAVLQMTAPDLPPEVWLPIALLTLGLPPRGVHSPYFAWSQWTNWCRAMARLLAVCQALRTALLGPEAAALWEQMALRSRYPGLSSSHSQGLVRLLIVQTRHARTAVLVSGRWDGQLLGQAVSSLCHTELKVCQVHTQQEAGIISAHLSNHLQDLVVHTSQPVRLPSSLISLMLLSSSPDILAPVRPLARLRRLMLGLTAASHMTSTFLAGLAQHHPLLTEFALQLKQDGLKQDLSSLVLPAGCTSQVLLRSCSATEGEDSNDISPALAQVASMQLHHLTITAYSLNLQQNLNLTSCSISVSLVLQMQHKKYHLGRRFLPAGAEVFHRCGEI